MADISTSDAISVRELDERQEAGVNIAVDRGKEGQEACKWLQRRLDYNEVRRTGLPLRDVAMVVDGTVRCRKSRYVGLTRGCVKRLP